MARISRPRASTPRRSPPRGRAHGALVPRRSGAGVASYWMEFFGHFTRGEAPEAVFVPIGLGWASAPVAARAATRATRIVGVVSAHAQATGCRSRRAPDRAPVSTQLPTAWPAAWRSRTRWPSSAARGRRNRQRERRRSRTGHARALRRHAQRRRRRWRPRWRRCCSSASAGPAAASASRSAAATWTARCSRGAFPARSTSLFAVVVVAGLAGLADVACRHLDRIQAAALAAAFSLAISSCIFFAAALNLSISAQISGLARVSPPLVGARPKPAKGSVDMKVATSALCAAALASKGILPLRHAGDAAEVRRHHGEGALAVL